MVSNRSPNNAPRNAYVTDSMLREVARSGTGALASQRLGRNDLAGKTGTTNEAKDVWFVGFSPDLVVGVYLGYDKPRHLGRGATGGVLAAEGVSNFGSMLSRLAIPWLAALVLQATPSKMAALL